MRVLIDIKHCAEVHFFRPIMDRMRARGDTMLVTAHYKPGVRDLLGGTGIEHTHISNPYPTAAGILLATALRTGRMCAVARRFRPDVLVGRTGIAIGAAGRMLGVPSVSFDENDHYRAQLTLSLALVSTLCTGAGFERDLGPKQVRLNALMQLAYTHPSRFTPDAGVLRAHGLDPDEPYAFIRLSAWQALHDLGYKGLKEAGVLSLIESLRPHARAVVSTEGPMPAALAPYANPVPVAHVLHVLAFAGVYVGEGGSMAAEAACVGTPAVWVSPLRCGFLNMLRTRYGLIVQTTDLAEAAGAAVEFLGSDERRASVRNAHAQMLADMGDPLDQMLETIDESVRTRRTR